MSGCAGRHVDQPFGVDVKEDDHYCPHSIKPCPKKRTKIGTMAPLKDWNGWCSTSSTGIEVQTAPHRSRFIISVSLSLCVQATWKISAYKKPARPWLPLYQNLIYWFTEQITFEISMKFCPWWGGGGLEIKLRRTPWFSRREQHFFF